MLFNTTLQNKVKNKGDNQLNTTLLVIDVVSLHLNLYLVACEQHVVSLPAPPGCHGRLVYFSRILSGLRQQLLICLGLYITVVFCNHYA